MRSGKFGVTWLMPPSTRPTESRIVPSVGMTVMPSIVRVDVGADQRDQRRDVGRRARVDEIERVRAVLDAVLDADVEVRHGRSAAGVEAGVAEHEVARRGRRVARQVPHAVAGAFVARRGPVAFDDDHDDVVERARRGALELDEFVEVGARVRGVDLVQVDLLGERAGLRRDERGGGSQGGPDGVLHEVRMIPEVRWKWR
jgi:hypothetical protein